MAKAKEEKEPKAPKAKLYVSKIQVARCVPRLKVNRVFDPARHSIPSGRLSGYINKMVADGNARPAGKGLKVGDYDEFHVVND